MSEQKSDPVDRPAHYTFGAIEVIDALEAWGLGFHLANVVKYVARSGHKGNYLQDLKKARWYLQREIERAERELEKLDRRGYYECAACKLWVREGHTCGEISGVAMSTDGGLVYVTPVDTQTAKLAGVSSGEGR